MADFRSRVLRHLFDLFPFDIVGDADVRTGGKRLISCIIPTNSRPFELERILSCLSMQDIDRGSLEVIVIEDGTSTVTADIVRSYASSVDVRLKSNRESCRSVGLLRNQGIELSVGKYLLFLDDDTLILQSHFLRTLFDRFEGMPDIDCVVIPGEPDRCLLEGKYCHLTRYSFGGACIAYRREALARIGGFLNDMASYEDIELSIRFAMSSGSVHRETELIYYHPPFYFTSWKKPIANGISFLRAYKRYSIPVWVLCYLNALRFLPFLVFPSRKHRQLGKISGGFLVAPLFKLLLRQEKSRPLYK